MSIRRKISMLLGLLAMVMAFQSIDRVFYLKSSAESSGTLATRVEKSLAATDTLSAIVVKVHEKSQVISTATLISEINAQSVSLDSLFGDGRSAASTLGVQHSVRRDVGTQLNSLSRALDRLIQARSVVILRSDDVETLRGHLRESATRLGTVLLSFELGSLEVLSRNEISGGEAARRLALLNRLRSLLTRVDDFNEGPVTKDLGEIQADIQRLLVSGIRAMAHTSDFAERARIAAVLSDIKRLISSPDGAAPLSEALASAQSEQASARSDFNLVLGQSGSIISRYVRASEEEIGQVYETVAQFAKDKLWREIVVNAGLGLGIVVAVWLVFARQISRRLESLAAEVLRLAAGDLSPVAKPDGNDELSRMMSALGVFRGNARELRRSNEELANFAYVASHDLRSPLRAIRDLVDWTLEDHAPDLTPPVTENLDLIRARSDRLSRLLQDLLDYARAGHVAYDRASVDVEALVAEVGEFVDIDDRLVLEYRGLGTIYAAETPLRTILMNLIGNAVKHGGPNRIKVLVTVARGADVWEISVADDGPGIEPKYQGQVFDLFRTLQSRDQVESSGLGLAMVQKLVGHLGGTITLVSNPAVQRGTTFTLRIPVCRYDVPQRTEINGVAA